MLSTYGSENQTPAGDPQVLKIHGTDAHVVNTCEYATWRILVRVLDVKKPMGLVSNHLWVNPCSALVQVFKRVLHKLKVLWIYPYILNNSLKTHSRFLCIVVLSSGLCLPSMQTEAAENIYVTSNDFKTG